MNILDDIEARVDAATPRPWEHSGWTGPLPVPVEVELVRAAITSALAGEVGSRG